MYHENIIKTQITIPKNRNSAQSSNHIENKPNIFKISRNSSINNTITSNHKSHDVKTSQCETTNLFYNQHDRNEMRTNSDKNKNLEKLDRTEQKISQQQVIENLENEEFLNKKDKLKCENVENQDKTDNRQLSQCQDEIKEQKKPRNKQCIDSRIEDKETLNITNNYHPIKTPESESKSINPSNLIYIPNSNNVKNSKENTINNIFNPSTLSSLSPKKYKNLRTQSKSNTFLNSWHPKTNKDKNFLQFGLQTNELKAGKELEKNYYNSSRCKSNTQINLYREEKANNEVFLNFEKVENEVNKNINNNNKRITSSGVAGVTTSADKFKPISSSSSNIFINSNSNANFVKGRNRFATHRNNPEIINNNLNRSRSSVGAFLNTRLFKNLSKNLGNLRKRNSEYNIAKKDSDLIRTTSMPCNAAGNDGNVNTNKTKDQIQNFNKLFNYKSKLNFRSINEFDEGSEPQTYYSNSSSSYLSSRAATTSSENYNNIQQKQDRNKISEQAILENLQNLHLPNMTKHESSESNNSETPTSTEKIEAKLKYVINELLDTEEKYTNDLNKIVTKIMPYVDNHPLPPPDDDIQQNQLKEFLFGNVSQIQTWHNDIFYPEMKACNSNIIKIASLFKKYQRRFKMYVFYCQNQPTGDFLFYKYKDSYFENLRVDCIGKLSFQDLMIKPVQRLMKYQLILKDCFKISKKLYTNEETAIIADAVNIMIDIPQEANDMMLVAGVKQTQETNYHGEYDQKFNSRKDANLFSYNIKDSVNEQVNLSRQGKLIKQGIVKFVTFDPKNSKCPIYNYNSGQNRDVDFFDLGSIADAKEVHNNLIQIPQLNFTTDGAANSKIVKSSSQRSKTSSDNNRKERDLSSSTPFEKNNNNGNSFNLNNPDIYHLGRAFLFEQCFMLCTQIDPRTERLGFHCEFIIRANKLQIDKNGFAANNLKEDQKVHGRNSTEIKNGLLASFNNLSLISSSSKKEKEKEKENISEASFNPKTSLKFQHNQGFVLKSKKDSKNLQHYFVCQSEEDSVRWFQAISDSIMVLNDFVAALGDPKAALGLRR